MAEEPKPVPPEVERMFARAQELRAQGLDFLRASRQADIEMRIGVWPAAWGDDLHVLIYGDFSPPDSDLTFPDLGIVVHSKPREGTVVNSGALCVLDATIKVSSKTIEGVLDAARRINLLLGTWHVVSWGHTGCSWWSHVSHGSGGGALDSFNADNNLHGAIRAVLAFPEEVRKRIASALYWIREPRATMSEWHRDQTLRIYVGYWNAFECLVEAVDVLRPANRISADEKQRAIDEFFKL